MLTSGRRKWRLGQARFNKKTKMATNRDTTVIAGTCHDGIKHSMRMIEGVVTTMSTQPIRLQPRRTKTRPSSVSIIEAKHMIPTSA